MTQSKHSFIRNSIFTFTRQVTNIVVGFLLIIVLARFLGPYGQGQYALITLVPTVIMIFLTLGINTSTIYYVSRDEVKLQTVYNNNIITGIVLSFTGVVLGGIFVLLFKDKFFADIPYYLLFLGLLSLPPLFLREYFQTVFQGLQDFKKYNSAMVIHQAAILGFVVLLVIVFDVGLAGAVSAFLLGSLFSFLYMNYQLRKEYHLRLSLKDFSTEYLKSSVKYGIKANISNAASFLNYRAVIFILGYYLVDDDVGRYVAAMNIGERLSIFAVSISSVLYPKIASTADEGGRNRITSIVSRSIMAVTVLVALIGIPVAPLIISLLGADFSGSILLLQVILPGIALLAVEKVLSNDIAGRGKPELNMYLSIFNVIFNIVINIIFIPKYGVIGAAYATTITYTVSFLVKIMIFKYVSGQAYSNFLILKRSDFDFYLNTFKKIKGKLKRA
jgi:O-antigen/teichoic acid export membrane protein